VTNASVPAPTAIMSDTLEQQGRARLGRYALWQLRDYFTEKAVSTIAVIVLTVYLTLVPAIAAYGRPRIGNVPRGFVEGFSTTLLTSIVVGALFATTGIVAEDRRLGFFRFYFAKPVRVWQFYAYKFVAYLVGFILVLAALMIVHAVLVGPFFPPAMLPISALLFVAIGGIGFLASAVWRYDWVTLSTVVFLSTIMWDLWEDVPGWRRLLVHVLPPMHRLGAVVGAASGRNPLPVLDLWWLTGYGAVCFVLGLLVLRRRSLATV
jgi:hypothetical protein